jgi:hypothetical protein
LEKKKMPEINVHDWIEIVGAIFAAGGFYQMMKSLKSDVSAIKSDLLKLNEVIMKVALNEQRQSNFEAATNERLAGLREMFAKAHQ